MSPEKRKARENVVNMGGGLSLSGRRALHTLPTSKEVFQDFPGGSDGKASVYNVRDLGLIPGLGRSPGAGEGYPLQYLLWPGEFRGQSMGSHRVGHD